MGSFEEELLRRLKLLDEENLRRRLRRLASPQHPRACVDGRSVLNFSSNDYLGLATHPALKEAAMSAIREFGTGSGASRLVCGSLPAHHELDEALADFKGTESALVFSTGYATALGTITALVSSPDIVVIDQLVHASIVDAARLSRAKLRVFAHNDLDDLEAILKWSDSQRSKTNGPKVLIVTESLFSMDGDIAPLREIVALKERFGAWLMVDEAHATGLFGQAQRGLVEELDLSGRVEVQMGTLGKALGAAGGYIAGSRALTDYLVNKARSFIFSTAPPPSVAASAKAALELVRSTEGKELLTRLRRNLALFSATKSARLAAEHSPIIPLIVGGEEAALQKSRALLEAGFLVPAIRFPTVARGKARLRLTFSAAHTEEEVRRLMEVI